MTVTPEPYTGAIFTLRYDECQTRITGWGFSDAWDWVFDATRPWLAKYPRYAAMKTETVRKPEEDFVGFEGEVMSWFPMTTEDILIVFPEDIHMVKVMDGESTLVEKACFKVKA